MRKPGFGGRLIEERLHQDPLQAPEVALQDGLHTAAATLALAPLNSQVVPGCRKLLFCTVEVTTPGLDQS